MGTMPIWLAANTGLKISSRVRYVFEVLYARIQKLH
jgi:hypothetical protein